MENRVTLSDILRIFFKKKALLLAVFIPIFILTAASAFLFPNYESSAVVMFSLKKRPTSIERERLDLKEGIAFIYTNVSLLKSRPVLLEVIKRLSLCKDEKKINEPEQTIQKLLKDISVEPLMFTNLVDIKVKRRNPNEAADIARTLIEVYKKWQISFLQEEIKVVSDFLDTELIKSKNRLDSAKEQLKDFKMKAGIGISDTIVAAKFEDVTQLYERIARNSADLELNQVRLSNAEEELCLKDVKVNGLAISQLAELLSDAEQVKLFERGLKDIETRMAYYLKSFTSDHPSVKGLLEQEAETKEALYHELCGVVKADKNADDSTAQLLESYLRLYTEKVVLEVIKEAFNLVARDSEDRKWNVRKDLMPDAEMEAAKMQREINLIQFFYEEEREEKELIEIARDLKDMGIVEVVSPPTISIRCFLARELSPR